MPCRRGAPPGMKMALCSRRRGRREVGGSLAHVACLDQQIAELSAAIRQRLAPQAAALPRQETIPGGGEPTAAVILTEWGAAMRRFASAGHAASGAGLCPGQTESGGRRRVKSH
jgi:transposase